MFFTTFVCARLLAHFEFEIGVCPWGKIYRNLRRLINFGAAACLKFILPFLTESGSVYSTGLNDFGQLGSSDDRSYTTVCFLFKWHVVILWSFSVLLLFLL